MIALILSMLINQLGAVTVTLDKGVKLSEDQNTSFANWTTCEELLEGSTFDEKRLFDVDWKVFYLWYYEFEDQFQALFRPPSESLVDRFREEVFKNVDNKSLPKVNWNASAFFMESTVDLSALFFRTEMPGKYNVVSSLIFHYQLDPEVSFGMKIVEPGYLVMYNCQVKMGYALAPINMMPSNDQLLSAVNLFKIRNTLGFPYNANNAPPDMPHVAESYDDADDEEEMEVQMQTGSFLD